VKLSGQKVRFKLDLPEVKGKSVSAATYTMSDWIWYAAAHSEQQLMKDVASSRYFRGGYYIANQMMYSNCGKYRASQVPVQLKFGNNSIFVCYVYENTVTF
jgi:hypothetical protein